MTNFEMVREFMTTFGQSVKSFPDADLPPHLLCEFRIKLIKEELDELIFALLFTQKENKEAVLDIAKELADLLYVVYGTGLSFGIDLDKVFAEVHRSNMSKLGPNGEVLRREDGKILKSENYTLPDLMNIVFPDN